MYVTDYYDADLNVAYSKRNECIVVGAVKCPLKGLVSLSLVASSCWLSLVLDGELIRARGRQATADTSYSVEYVSMYIFFLYCI